jgi:hypothetical protein
MPYKADESTSATKGPEETTAVCSNLLRRLFAQGNKADIGDVLLGP